MTNYEFMEKMVTLNPKLLENYLKAAYDRGYKSKMCVDLKEHDEARELSFTNFLDGKDVPAEVEMLLGLIRDKTK